MFNRVFHEISPSILGVKYPYFWFNTHISGRGTLGRGQVLSLPPKESPEATKGITVTPSVSTVSKVGGNLN